MVLESNAYYVVCVLSRGMIYWSGVYQGGKCFSSNVKRTTMESVGYFLASLALGRDSTEKDVIKIYRLPDLPVMAFNGGESK